MLTRSMLRAKGFTLIEMLTVTAIVALLSLIVIGRLQNLGDGIQFQRAIQNIETAANKAKSQAIQTGQTYELTFDNSTQSLTAQPLSASSNSTTKAPTTKTSTTKGSTTTPNKTDQQDITLGTGWSVFEVRKSNGTTETDLSIKFYADGTAETKSAELHSGNAPVSLIVKQNGSIEVKRGALSDQQNEEWEAGNIEQRSNQ